MIVDSHVHIFNKICGRIKNSNTISGEWGTVKCGSDFIQIMPPYNKKTQFKLKSLLKYMEYENIDKAVILQGCFWGNHNKLVKQAIKNYPHRLAGAMYIEPWQRNSRKYFERNIGYFNALKLEISLPTGFLGWRDNFKLTDYMWLYKEISKKNKTLVLDLGEAGTSSYQTEEVKHIIDKFGDIKIVICHLAQPRKHYIENKKLMREWINQIKLSRYGNVAFDTASISTYFFNEVYPYDTGRRFFEMAIEITGTERIIMGTDLPANSFCTTYKQMLYLPEIYGNYIGLNKKEISDILGNNGIEFYFGDKSLSDNL